MIRGIVNGFVFQHPDRDLHYGSSDLIKNSDRGPEKNESTAASANGQQEEAGAQQEG
jgi:hypothetical protein